jgi:hypothetical protein
MKLCQQTSTQSVYQHGLSVRDHLFQLIQFLETGQIEGTWRLPDWLSEYRQELLKALYPKEIIEEYAIFHDCSKPYCIQYDEAGRKHFPNHAELSYQKWLEVGGNQEAATLMKMDMDIHCLKDKDVESFGQRPQAITLLLTGLAEVHSNSKMFGGIESDSFKIKWNQINKRGNAILKKLYKGKQNVLVER